MISILYLHWSVHRESNLVIFQKDVTVFSLSHFCRQLYMFQVLTHIIRSWYNCNYSFWYWSTRSTTIRSRCWVGTYSCVSYGRYSFVMQMGNYITFIYSMWHELIRWVRILKRPTEAFWIYGSNFFTQYSPTCFRHSRTLPRACDQNNNTNTVMYLCYCSHHPEDCPVSGQNMTVITMK